MRSEPYASGLRMNVCSTQSGSEQRVRTKGQNNCSDPRKERECEGAGMLIPVTGYSSRRGGASPTVLRTEFVDA